MLIAAMSFHHFAEGAPGRRDIAQAHIHREQHFARVETLAGASSSIAETISTRNHYAPRRNVTALKRHYWPLPRHRACS